MVATRDHCEVGKFSLFLSSFFSLRAGDGGGQGGRGHWGQRRGYLQENDIIYDRDVKHTQQMKHDQGTIFKNKIWTSMIK